MRIPSIPGFDPQAFEKYFKNTGMLFIGKVGSQVIKMVISIMIANYLQPEKNGVLAGGYNYIYFFSAIASLGIDQFIVRELHTRPQQKSQILGSAFLLKILAGVICIPLIYLTYQLYPLAATPYSYVLILSFTGLLQAFNVIEAYFQSQVQSKFIMQVQIAGNLCSAVIKLSLIWLHAPLLWFVYAYLADVALLSAGYLLTYQQKIKNIRNWSFDNAIARTLLNASWPLIISGIMVSVYMRIDQLMLQNMRGAAEAGIYATAVNFSEAWNFVPIVIVTSLFPAILNARRDDNNRYRKRLQNLYDLMVYISVPIAFVITFASPLIYQLFKPAYAVAAPVLSVSIWSGVFVFLGVANGQYLIAENHIKLTFIRTGVGALINVGLNLLLIPSMGMMGTALATLMAYGCSTLFVLFIPAVHRQGIMMLRSLLFINLFRKLYTLLNFRKNPYHD